MASLADAMARLEHAVARVAAAVDVREAAVDRDREALRRAAEDARGRHARALAAAEQVSERLDGAIARLNAVLEP